MSIPAAFLPHLSAKGIEYIEKTRKFVDEFCLPADPIFHRQLDAQSNRWAEVPKITEALKAEAKKQGLWNMFLNKMYPEGPGFSNLEYGLMAEQLGKSFIGPTVTNCNAPDTGNMELLARYGTPYQKDRWLKPLLNGDIRSAFLMTEKGTSSSNALNISCSAIKNANGNYVLNGVKWFASGAGEPHCNVWLVMCKTSDDKAKPYRNHTVLVLDAKKALATGKAKLIRPLTVFGYDDAPHGHFEISFENYEVPAEDMPNVLLTSEGRGFEMIQSRLGPGRIHHCMRLIGVGEYSLQIVAHRATERIIFGRPMAERESFITAFAKHKINIEKCRLLVLNAAHKIDLTNPKAATREIAMAKIETPRTILETIDWCVQMFGAEGVSQDTYLARMWANNRTLRIADGPDEAHLNQLGRSEAKKFKEAAEYLKRIHAKTQSLSKL